MKGLIAASLVFLVATSFCGCASGGERGDASARIEGITWRLVEAGGTAAPPVAADARAAFFRLDGGENRVTGYTGVNQFGGPYERQGSRLKFGDLVMTKMAGPPALMRQEAAFAAALTNTASWREAGAGTVELLDGSGTAVASFVADQVETPTAP